MNEQPKMNQQPVCTYCGQGPFPDLKKWALHRCCAKPQMAEVIAQLRIELEEAREVIQHIKNTEDSYDTEDEVACKIYLMCEEFLHKQREPKP